MLRENKRKLFLSSAVILLPVLFGLIVWNRLPGTLITHWGADGKADGSAAKALAVFGLPLAHLLVHLLCLCLTLRDPKQQRQSPRALGMVFSLLLAHERGFCQLVRCNRLEPDFRVLFERDRPVNIRI